jgi:hypothetical protein
MNISFATPCGKRRLLIGMLFVSLAVPLTSLSGCSIPTLSTPACVESRDVVRELYAYHFGHEMLFSQENLKERERFLTPRFAASLKEQESENDVFTTNSTDIPKAFRVGVCTETAPDRTKFQVLLFWRSDDRTEQRPIDVEVVLTDVGWRVDNIKY